jgi:hypothetical protein
MPTSIPEAELDALVIEALTDHLMTPERLTVLLREALRHRREMAAQTTGRRQAIKAGLKSAEVQIERLLTAVATGALPDMSLLRAKIDELNAQREECNRHLPRPALAGTAAGAIEPAGKVGCRHPQAPPSGGSQGHAASLRARSREQYRGEPGTRRDHGAAGGHSLIRLKSR